MIQTHQMSVLFYFVAEPLFRLWNPVFAPYAKYVWLYGLSMGVHALIDVVCRVEMARHRYGVLAWLVVPTILVCGWFYFFSRGTATLSQIIGVMAAGRLVVLAGVLICSVRRRGEVPTKV